MRSLEQQILKGLSYRLQGVGDLSTSLFSDVNRDQLCRKHTEAQHTDWSVSGVSGHLHETRFSLAPFHLWVSFEPEVRPTWEPLQKSLCSEGTSLVLAYRVLPGSPAGVSCQMPGRPAPQASQSRGHCCASCDCPTHRRKGTQKGHVRFLAGRPIPREDAPRRVVSPHEGRHCPPADVLLTSTVCVSFAEHVDRENHIHHGVQVTWNFKMV